MKTKFSLIMILCACTHTNDSHTLVHETDMQSEKQLARSDHGDWELSNDVKPSDSPHRSYEGYYSISKPGCQLRWYMSKARDSGQLTLRMNGIEQGYKNKNNLSTCPKSLNDRIAVHGLVLKAIHEKWGIAPNSEFMTQHLEPVPASEKPTIEIAVHSSTNIDYVDYKKNYPKHRSKKTTNRILKELITEHEIDQGLHMLFQFVGINIELMCVEKVFTVRGTQLKTAVLPHELRRSQQRVMTGAGMYWYKTK